MESRGSQGFLTVSSPPRQPTDALSTVLLRVLPVSILSPKRAHTHHRGIYIYIYRLWTISPRVKLCGAQESSNPAPHTSAVSAIREAISGPSGTPTGVASRHLHTNYYNYYYYYYYLPAVGQADPVRLTSPPPPPPPPPLPPPPLPPHCRHHSHCCNH